MKRLVLTILILFTGLTLSACGQGKPSPTITPTSTITFPPAITLSSSETPTIEATPTETLTPTPTEALTLETSPTITTSPSATVTLTPKPGPLVKTSRGDYTIKDVLSTDRFPLACSATDCSLIAPANFQVIVVVLERVTPDFAPGNFMMNRVYVETADGLQGILLAQTYSSDNKQEYLAFELPSFARYIKLYWPGNQPISLVVK